MKKILAAFTLFALAGAGHPATFLVGDLGYTPGGGFRTSLLHEGTDSFATGGTILAWLAFDPSWAGSSLDAVGTVNDGQAFYRESDGALELRALVYPHETHPFTSAPLGTVVITGTGFTPANLDAAGRTHDVMGGLNFAFDISSGPLFFWLGAGDATRELLFVDSSYFGAFTVDGTQANGKSATELALWGAMGDALLINVHGRHQAESDWFAASGLHQLGSDLDIDLGGLVTDCVTADCHPTPEPATLGLLALGLVGLMAVRKR
jgi:hypothetical protein